MPESPPRSPPLAAAVGVSGAAAKGGEGRAKGPAHTVAEECERLFCGTLGAVFLGEGERLARRPLATGAHHHLQQQQQYHNQHTQYAKTGRVDSVIGMADAHEAGALLVDAWVEVFDYAGGACFRGFIAGDGDERTLFVFFDEGVVGNDLKPGLLALLELCETPSIGCPKLVACLDRLAEPEQLAALSRDLGWVGFEPYTLIDWTDGDDILSDAWVFLSMDV